MLLGTDSLFGRWSQEVKNGNDEVGIDIRKVNVCGWWVTQSCQTLWDPTDSSPPGSSVHGDSPGKNTGVSCHALLQGVFSTQRSNPGLPNCRQILYQLSHKGSPKKLEWVAYPFSRGTSWPRNRTRVSCIAGGFFTSWAAREAPRKVNKWY